MHNGSRTSSGYILLLVVMIISLLSLMATYIALRVHTYYPAMSYPQTKAQAHLLALGGVHVGMAQLVDFFAAKKDKEVDSQQKKANPDEESKQFLTKLLPKLNQWQTFPLEKNIEGVAGSIKICISSEDGKLDLNQLWDFKNDQFAFEKQENKKKLFQDLFSHIEKVSKKADLFTSLQKMFKTRGYVFNDVSELLMIQEYQKFANHLFYEPIDTKEEAPVCLADIFTIWTGKQKLSPWLFSSAWQRILDLKSVKNSSVEQALKEFKKNTQWTLSWDKTVSLLYEKNFNSLPKNMDLLFEAKFEPKIFSVLSYGIFDKTTDKVLAILELATTKEKDGAQKIEVKVRKLYWL
ncbi:MAG: type II secretion system protein GspK [Candidatus Dependentiae bacterium]|nr:type II secretion system protein GspK [Candidatus Dependentiae bacterium]MCL5875261.1 type II secretion system protein GspK [Candidatus Dependentiae bacterium]